jgi:hypothetical protein
MRRRLRLQDVPNRVTINNGSAYPTFKRASWSLLSRTCLIIRTNSAWMETKRDPRLMLTEVFKISYVPSHQERNCEHGKSTPLLVIRNDTHLSSWFSLIFIEKGQAF